MIKISVIIPVYCVEKYLKECLDSIFQQTLKEIEVICINDGSNDNSLMILNEFKEKYSDMVVYTQENAGSGSARNTGIKIAQGNYLMFVDPDDFLAERDAMESLYAAAEKNQAEVCGGNLLKMINNVVSLHNDGVFANYIPRNGVFTFRDYQFAYGHTRYIIRKDLLVNNDIFYPKYQRGQDIAFIAKALNAANKICLIDKNIYVHRKGHKKVYYTEKKADDFVESLYDVVNLAIDNGLNELFNMYVKQMNRFAKQVWYAQIQKANSWEKIDRINQCIQRGNVIFKYNKKVNCLMKKDEYAKYSFMMEKQWEELEKNVVAHKNLFIYGAGEIGKKVLKYLKDKNCIPKSFVVSDSHSGETTVDNIPIIPVDALNENEECLFILSAANSQIRKDMEKHLLLKGYHNILNLNADIFIYKEME